MQYFGFTVKNTNKRMPIYEDYHDWMENAKAKGFDIQTVGYELDSKERLHIHGIALASPRFTFKKVMFRKYHQYIEEIPSNNDLMRWSDYCKKDFDKRYIIEQTVVKQMIQSNYMFI